MRSLAIGVVLTVGSLVGGCGSGGGGGGGGSAAVGWEVTDSAGVVLVRNPAGDGGDPRTAGGPVLEPDLTIGELGAPMDYQFGSITGIDVDAQGRIYVLDEQASTVRVFDASGELLQTMGRPGAGPGELSGTPRGLLVDANGVVHVADPRNRRIQAFAPDGSSAGTTPLTMDPALGRFSGWPRSGETLVFQATPILDAGDGRSRLQRVDVRSGRVDTIAFLEPPPPEGQRPYGPAARWTVREDGRMIVGRTDEYRFLVVEPDGTVERVVTRALAPERFTEAERTAIRERVQRGLLAQASGPFAGLAQGIAARVEAGSHYHAYQSLAPGPRNTVLAQRVAPLETLRQGGALDLEALARGTDLWDLYDAEGRLLGTVELPRRFRPIRAVGDHLYGVARGDFDVSLVMRLVFRP